MVDHWSSPEPSSATPPVCVSTSNPRRSVGRACGPTGSVGPQRICVSSQHAPGYVGVAVHAEESVPVVLHIVHVNVVVLGAQPVGTALGIGVLGSVDTPTHEAMIHAVTSSMILVRSLIAPLSRLTNRWAIRLRALPNNSSSSTSLNA